MCWYMPPPVLPQFELDRGRAVRGDGHVLGDQARLVVGGPTVLVDAFGPEPFVPHGDLVGAGRDAVDLESAVLVGDGDVRAVVDDHPREHVRVGVAQHAHHAGLREAPGDVDHLVPVRQRQVEDGHLGQEAVRVVKDAVGVLHASLGADRRGRDVADEHALVVVEQDLARRLLALRDALDEDHGAADTIVRADHERLRRLAISADVPILVDGQRLQHRRRPRELHVATDGAAVLDRDLLVGGGRRHGGEHEQGAEQCVLRTRCRAPREPGGLWTRVAPHAYQGGDWGGRLDLPNVHDQSAQGQDRPYGSGLKKYSSPSHKLRLYRKNHRGKTIRNGTQMANCQAVDRSSRAHSTKKPPTAITELTA